MAADEVFHFGLCELMRLIVVAQEMPEFSFYHHRGIVIFAMSRAGARSYKKSVFQVGDERFIYHVVDDLTGCVERTRLFARSRAGFRVIRREQVLEHLTEQFGIQCHLLLYRRILGNRELVAIEDVD